ncbi:MAG: PhzF family phenazine biosynthesis protein [Wenzhouxiangellaceae bacterium]
MSAELEFEIWDVFTRRRYAGNPLAVVFGADALDPAAMLAITREFDFSESVFVQRPSNSEFDFRLRIFTPAGELPFAGHPTVGSACALAHRANAESLVLELGAGRFATSFKPHAGGVMQARFRNPNLPRISAGGPSPDRIEAALSLPPGSVDRAELAPARAGAGIDFVYARIESVDRLAGASLTHSAWDALQLESSCGLLAWAPSGAAPDGRFRARMFAPHIGVPEDPATGSAAAALPAHLLAGGLLEDGEHHLIVEQGIEIGRPSRIEVIVEVADGAVRGVDVAGDASPVMRGVLRPPG